jgi:hypothetical protein
MYEKIYRRSLYEYVRRTEDELILRCAMGAYEGVNLQIHIFVTSALVGSEWSVSRPGRFTPRERASVNHWIGGWVGPKAYLDDMEKGKFLILSGIEFRPLGRPAHGQSLYRLFRCVNFWPTACLPVLQGLSSMELVG